MKYPNFLKTDGTIGLVAPSCGAAFEPYISTQMAAIEYFKSLGYKIEEGPNIYKGDGIGISTNPKDCGQELTDFYCSGENDILISCGGGELMCETLDYVDFDRIKEAAPKWYMGYSDNTNFTFLLNTICDVASIYGPCVGSFGARKLHKSHEDAIEIFTGKRDEVSSYEGYEILSLKSEEDPLAPYNLTEKSKVMVYVGEKTITEKREFSGRIVGGCLDCLVNLCGTKYDYVKAFNEKYKADGVIWFLEACDLNLMSYRRALWNLDRAGWFENASGFIIGRPRASYQAVEWGIDTYQAVTGIIGKYNVPIVMDADIGHLPPMMPIVSGAYTNCIAENAKLNIKYFFDK